MARSLLQWIHNRPATKQHEIKARLNVERLEDRIVPSWTTPPTIIAVPPPNTVNVTLNTSGDVGGSAAITSNEIDYFRFTARTAGSYTISASKAGGRLDTVIGVFDAAGNRIAFNDDISSNNANSRLTVTLAAGQTYYLGVTNYTGSRNGNYTWSINGPSDVATDDIYEQNDSFSAAFNLGTLTSTQTYSSLNLLDGNDWFRFTTSFTSGSSNAVSISFTHTQGDLDLELYNSAGTRIGLSDSVANGESISLNGLAAGTYYVRVLGYNGASNPNYSLTVNVPSSDPAPPSTGAFDIQLRLSGLTASQALIFEQAAQRWESIIIGDIPNATYQGVTVDDLLIDASSIAIDGVGGVLGQAGPDTIRSTSFLPLHGIMQFDTADLANLEANGQLMSVVMHEIGHILGIGTIWNLKGLITGAGTASDDPRFTGAQAVAEYNALFGTNATGVPVENGGGAGTADSHWEESIFGNELLTGYLNSGFNPISRMTIASLADLGYQVDLTKADFYAPPGSLQTTGSGTSSGSAALVAGRGKESIDVDPAPFVNLTPTFFNPNKAANLNRLDAFFTSASLVLGTPALSTGGATILSRFSETTSNSLASEATFALSGESDLSLTSLSRFAYQSGSDGEEMVLDEEPVEPQPEPPAEEQPKEQAKER